MSLTLSRRPNDTTDNRKAGYFRIGCITLQIPPQDIITSHIANDDKAATLRGKAELHTKTGQARWDVTIRWTALKGEVGEPDEFYQWEQLTDLVAMFKAAPFVEVESPHLRQVITGGGAARIAMALRQLRVDTHPDIVDGLTVTLTMTLFNYAPYSIDFGYIGAGGAEDAYRSGAFRTYLNAWKAANGMTSAWQGLTAGALRLTWREYQAVTTGQAPRAIPPVTAPTPSLTPGTSSGLPAGLNLAGADARVVENYRKLTRDLLGPIQAYMPVRITSGYRSPSRNLAAGGKTTSQHLAEGDAAAVDLAPTNGAVVELFNWIRNSNLPYDQVILESQNGRPTIVHVSYRTGSLNRRMALTGTTGNSPSYTLVSQGPPISAATQLAATPTPAGLPSNFVSPLVTPTPEDAAAAAAWKAEFARTAETMAGQGWTYDHAVNEASFFYRENVLELSRSGEQLGPETGPTLVPTSVSVLLVNNLAQIPLANYQYPTYQHVGPCSSLVSLVFESKGGRTSEEEEPDHPGVTRLGAMVHTLENQYRQLRTTFRKVKSLHQMQAVMVEHDVLNMLGITGLMVGQLGTETVPDAADLVLVNLTAAQYENIFDKIQIYAPKAKGATVGDHAAYADLGLVDLGVDPGQYFVNDNDEYRAKATACLSETLATAKAAQEEFNKLSIGSAQAPGPWARTAAGQTAIGAAVGAGLSGTGGVGGLVGSAVASGIGARKVGAAVEEFTRSSVYEISADNAIPSDPNEVMRMINIPGYQMAEAFPTFKLFFMQENSLGVFTAFDNFYSYASVIDVEIIKPKDKPWTMVLQLTNLAHLLNHQTFDNTMAGALEKEYVPSALMTPAAEGPDGELEAVMSPEGAVTYAIGGKNQGSPWITYDVNGKSKPGPLMNFPLQTGTKVQLRIGYSNDPDKLTPVFGGIVTEIFGDNILTITCQSFLLELAQGAAGSIPGNSRMHFGGLATFSEGPAFGGVHFLGSDGDNFSVMSVLIRDAKAKHFGHWQVDTDAGKFLKGHAWLNAIGSTMAQAAKARPDDLGAPVFSRIGEALAHSGTRADENILINRRINTGGQKSARGDHFGDAGGANPLKPWAYYVDSKTSLSIWDLIKDVARRYPEYILAEKLYGHPRGCEATLVYGHPFDWYYARPEYVTDAAEINKADVDHKLYQQWWAGLGRQMVEQTLHDAEHLGPLWRRMDPYDIEDAGKSPDDLDKFLSRVLRDYSGFQGTEDAWWQMIQEILRQPLDAITPQSQNDGLRQIGLALRNIERSYHAYVMSRSRGKEAAFRIQPIRKYHFIDHNTIIHNGMAINDKIYNGVQIGDGDSNGKVIPFKANGSIPDHHLRMLDVTEEINDPKRNVIDPSTIVMKLGGKSGLAMAYAQSFMKEEVGKMYRGEIVLRGTPAIEPHDILMLLDPSTAMAGPVEVDQVIHSFNLETGYITIVKPRAVVAVNEASSAQFLGALWNTLAITLPSVMRLKDLGGWARTGLAVKAAVPVAGSALAIYAAPKVAAGVASSIVTAGAVVETGAGALAAHVGTSVASTAVGVAALNAGSAVAGAATASGAAINSGAAAIAAGGIVSNPVGWAVGLIALTLGSVGLVYWTDLNSAQTPMIVTPVIRFGKPWVGGLNGWLVTDLVGVLNAEARQWVADNIKPMSETWEAIVEKLKLPPAGW